ncbi:hypothetical protein MBOT_07090 [Mycobacterium botniense]|uniref:PPE domain-containing protein n=1 Tax=Mycobacterium botniense TaxID=84962 RepID=A0A7I9XTN0_9MYCO|nr:hypothetical protein MBOT_07090 [Mycobacterium botniense]
MDFAALPPEINSARMYTGAGSGPLMAAAAAWDGVAAELSSAATSYRGVIAELTDDMWLGPSSMSMSTAAASFAAWMGATAAQAEQTANQIRSAAAAYEAAFAAMVPPPVIEANRALLANLVATNVIGQNTAAIAATEAQYSEMWAQDAAAMFGYAGASAAATKVTPFTPAPHTTNPAGTAAQSAATAHAAASATANTVQSTLSSVPNTLHGLASGSTSFNPLATLAKVFSSPPFSTLDGLSGSSGEYALVYASSAYLTGGLLAQEFPLMALALPKAAAAAGAVTPELGAGLGTLAGSSAPAGAAGLGGVSAGLGEAELVGVVGAAVVGYGVSGDSAGVRGRAVVRCRCCAGRRGGRAGRLFRRSAADGQRGQRPPGQRLLFTGIAQQGAWSARRRKTRRRRAHPQPSGAGAIPGPQ